MKVTINWTDHRYKTYDFSIVDDLPEVGNRIYNENDGTFSECDNIRDITDMSARSDWGDGGYYSLYEVRYITGETEDGKDVEDDCYEYKHVAIWNSYEAEEGED